MLYIMAKVTAECGCCQSPVRGAPMQKATNSNSHPDDSEPQDLAFKIPFLYVQNTSSVM